MSPRTLAQFTQTAHERGYAEVVVREWAPLHEVPEHTHPFDVSAHVVRGEFWLTVGTHTTHLQAGDDFQLARDVPHQERYGAEGATVWVGRAS